MGDEGQGIAILLTFVDGQTSFVDLRVDAKEDASTCSRSRVIAKKNPANFRIFDLKNKGQEKWRFD